jgi:hypothetical protein
MQYSVQTKWIKCENIIKFNMKEKRRSPIYAYFNKLPTLNYQILKKILYMIPDQSSLDQTNQFH